MAFTVLRERLPISCSSFTSPSDDVTNIIGIQADLQRKQEEMDNLNKRFQETYTKLKVARIEKDSANRTTSFSRKDLVIESIKPDRKKFIAGDFESENKLINNVIDQKEDITWKGKPKIIDEIDENCDVSEESFKTKKLKDKDLE